MTFSNNFIPASNIIASITQADPGVVTTATNHGYSDGLFVRLIIPSEDGMEQGNNQTYVITVLSPNTFSLNVDTKNFTSFRPPMALITSITKSNPAVIGVSADNFSLNEEVFISGVVGMIEINGRFVSVVNVIPGFISVSIDSSLFTAYMSGGLLNPIQSAQVIPYAEVALTLSNAERNARNIIPET